jgi:branched-chain amino acid transport system ATP-binding protein
MLEVSSLGIEFGGVHAVSNVTFTVQPHEVFTIIGPNGAGKTTLFNMISGLYRPTSGDIRFGGRSIVDVPVHRLAQTGISRTFQNLQVFMEMTALENVLVGRHLHLKVDPLRALWHSPSLKRDERAARDKALGLLDIVGLFRHADTVAASLSYGVLKRLEIARALAAEPKLLLLDEPAAGLNQTEKLELTRLIEKIAKSGVTVMLVEHDMKLVMQVSQRILVLHHGEKLAEGTPAAVRENQAVIDAYLGAELA